MNTELIEYYTDLLIMQYRDKTKARGHVGNILSAGMIYDIMIAVRDGFDLETAIGAQLDVLGRILGVSRTITGTTFTRSYYGYILYGDTAPFTFNPMLLYGVEAGDVQFRNYTEGQQSLYDLTDEEYRVILKLAIVRNNSNASVKTIDEILNNIFGAECYFIDRMNMTVVSYMVGAKWSRIFQIAKASGLLPNPAGVGTSLVVVPDINNIFAYSLYGGATPDFAVGYGRYSHPGTWMEAGNYTDFPGFSLLEITSLTDSLAIMYAYLTQELQAVSFDGSTWQKTGTPLSPAGSGVVAKLSRMDDENIVMTDYSKIGKYHFDGSDITLVGNEFSHGLNITAVKALSDTRIIVHTNSGSLRAYDFDGSDWSLVGTPISVGSGFSALMKISSSQFVLINQTLHDLRVYDFDGSDFTLIGNVKDIDSIGYPAGTELTSSRICFVDSDNRNIRTFDFDGIDFTEQNDPQAVPIIDDSPSSITRMTETRIALSVDIVNPYAIQSYDLEIIHDLTGCMASYS